MEEIIGNISIGILLGLVVIYFISEMGLQDENNKHQKNDRLQKQRENILNELSQKQPESTDSKNQAVALVYQSAASKNRFTLKDIEQISKNLQNHYGKTIENESAYKMNFPEKEILNFEPQETLQLLTIINEGLHNAVIHSQANFIFNIASVENDILSIITHDNGIGYNRKEITDKAGINNIIKAVENLKADLKLTSTIGNGTVVNVEIPIT